MGLAGERKGMDVWFVLICLAMLCLSMVGVCEFSMDVQGSIFCLSSQNKATPINGAKAKIICEEGPNRGDRSIVSRPASSKGFYFAKAKTKSKLGNCKAFLKSSPQRNCSFPTDINGGRRGAALIPFSNDGQHYSVQSFFYSPSPPN